MQKAEYIVTFQLSQFLLSLISNGGFNNFKLLLWQEQPSSPRAVATNVVFPCCAATLSKIAVIVTAPKSAAGSFSNFQMVRKILSFQYIPTHRVSKSCKTRLLSWVI